MRIPRFYCPVALQAHSSFALPEPTFHHAIQVLRLKVGEPLCLFNGEGGEYRAVIKQIERRSAQVDIEDYYAIERESSLSLTLALALIKPDKMDFALQKAAELGVSHIQPLITQRSVIKLGKDKSEKKQQHWQGVIVSACEQSGRTRIPTLAEPITLSNYLVTRTVGTHLVLAVGDFPRLTILPPDLPPPLSVLIGPEGGLSDEEVIHCIQSGVQAVSLGERVLRAETACLTALAILQSRWGDL